MIWAVFMAMTLAAAGALLIPFLRQRGSGLSRAAYDVEIYRDQLAEIQRDVQRGLIGEAEAKAARTEIARRALAADTAERASAKTSTTTQALPMAVLALAVVIPMGAFVLYLDLGSPHLPGQPLATRHAGAQSDTRQDEALIAQLAERLKERPDDLQGWTLLARSLSSLGRHDESVAAWRNVRRLAPDAAESLGGLAEALVQASGGTITPEAVRLFEAATKADENDPRSRFYLGLARSQAGESRQALQIWTDLLAISPPDAPWLEGVRAQLRRVAGEAKIDPATLTPSPAAASLAARNAAGAPPSGPQAEAIARLPAAQQQQMIRGMVDSLAARLESEPNDLEGWRRLGRARKVLGENEKSVEAYAKAASLAPGRVEVLTEYAAALFETVPPGGKLPEPFVAVMRQILEVDPNHGDALWFTGLAEAEAGRRAAAVALWQRLLDQLPADAKERQEVRSQIDRLMREPN
jgi:cytochrome c-type biogenesis protein CcmH